MKRLFLAAATLFLSSVAMAEVVEFTIPFGTGQGPWNLSVNPIEAKLGDTIRFHNEDTVEHQLHTYGSPCPHGNNMYPGDTWDCEVTSTLDSSIEGALYDHHYGEDAAVWFQVTE